MSRVIYLFIIIAVYPSVLFGADWYVRPAGGSYGLENGTSYENAWDGIENILWGTQGVKAGDNLFICGTHIASGSSGVFSKPLMAKTSGTAESWITIRGDYPSDKAIVWGAWKDQRDGGLKIENWQSLGNDVYYNKASVYNKLWDSFGVYENISGSSYLKYKAAKSKDEVINSPVAGLYYIENDSTNTGHVWVKPFNNISFKDNLRFSGFLGYQVLLNGDYSYIRYKNIDFYATDIDHISPEKNHTYYEFDGCKFISMTNTLYFYTPRNASNITFTNCEIAYAPNGIYVIWNYGQNEYITVKNSYFHDIARIYSPNGVADGHAIGIQNNQNFWIMNNRFERCGSAIDCHVGALKTQRNIVIHGNYIDGMLIDYANPDIAPGAGIQLEGDNDCPKGNTGNITISYNIVINCQGNGIATTRKDTVSIYNNLVSNCPINYAIVGNRVDGASASFYNNISIRPLKYHVYFNQNATNIRFYFNGNNNLFFDSNSSTNLFYFVVSGFTGKTPDFLLWKRLQADAQSLGFNLNSSIIDDKSLFADPRFVDYQNKNFRLSGNSPCINSGAYLGQTSDFSGREIKESDLPDIGPMEYKNIPAPKGLTILSN